MLTICYWIMTETVIFFFLDGETEAQKLGNKPNRQG